MGTSSDQTGTNGVDLQVESSVRRLQFTSRSILLATAAAACLLGIMRHTVDPVGTAAGPVFAAHTIYTPGYTNLNWHRVSLGMSKPEVLSILGPPMGSVEQDEWRYSKSDPHVSENYQRRILNFRNGTLSEKVNDLWVD